jgi:hypothetical protein
MARPEFQVTDELRRRVAIAAGSGTMTHEEIAIGLGISRPTLEKHFVEELAEGAYRKRLEVLEAMHAAALKGNITAQREYLSRSPRASPTRPPEQPEKPEKVGKKEQADRDARTAHEGTEWETLLRKPTQLQ